MVWEWYNNKAVIKKNKDWETTQNEPYLHPILADLCMFELERTL